jgi:hypothetical protein
MKEVQSITQRDGVTATNFGMEASEYYIEQNTPQTILAEKSEISKTEINHHI